MDLRHEEDDITELYSASMSGCTTTLNSLIHKDPRLLNKISLTDLGETPLHISALVGHLDFSRALLDLKPQLASELDSLKRCPLHLASAEGHTQITRALLHVNDNACLIRDQDGRIPLHYAAMRGRVEVVRELIVAQPNSIRVMLDGEKTVLHLCVKYNQLEVLKLLVESVSDDGEFLNSQDHEGGNTILHYAVMLKQIETVKYLLSVSKVKEGANALNWMGFSASKFLEHSPTDFKSLIIRNILMDAGLEKRNTQDNLAPPSITVVHNHESAKLAQPSKKRRNWLECLKYKGDWIEETRGALMVVATVITTITFQPAISPPGGVWQANENDTSQGSNCSPESICAAGTSVAGSSNFLGYQTFMLCNSSSFIASLCVVFLLISGFPLKNKICMGLLTFAMCTTITFLALAYFFAVHLVDPGNNLYGSPVTFIVLPTYGFLTIMAVVLLIHTVRFVAWVLKKTRKLLKVIHVGQT